MTTVNFANLSAQSGTSSAISGTVLDASGAALPGAAITATLNFNLAVSAGSQTVEVTAQQTLLSLENPNPTTTKPSRNSDE